MIRYFENRDKYGILELAAEYHGDDFDLGTFAGMFDDIVNGNEMVKGISILHAGEFLGYSIIYTDDKIVVYNQLYVKPKFQKLGVAPQVFDFVEKNFPGYKYKAVCPADNEIAIKVFTKRGYDVLVK